MELKMQALADIVMDEEALEKMLDSMTVRELWYLSGLCSAIASRKQEAANAAHAARGYIHADGSIRSVDGTLIDTI